MGTRVRKRWAGGWFETCGRAEDASCLFAASSEQTMLCSAVRATQSGRSPRRNRQSHQVRTTDCSFDRSGRDRADLCDRQLRRSCSRNEFLDVEFLPGQEETAKDYARSCCRRLIPSFRSDGGSTKSANPELAGCRMHRRLSAQGMLLIPLGAELTNAGRVGHCLRNRPSTGASLRAPGSRKGWRTMRRPRSYEEHKGLQAALDYLNATPDGVGRR